MKTVLELWKTRLEEHVKEIRSYSRYMLNDHLLIVMVFLLAGGALWYQSWLKELPDNFPAAILIAVIFAAVLVFSSVRTLFKEADLVFLLPLEEKMQGYLKKAKRYSYLQSLLPLIILYLVLGPLHLAVAGDGTAYLFTGIVVLSLNASNIECEWHLSFSEEISSSYWDKAVRFALNAAILYLVLSGTIVYAAAVGVLMTLLLMYYKKTAKGKGLKWDRLIKAEYRKKQAFYRLANLFTDVPKLKKEARRRAWLDWTLKNISYGKNSVYMYMLARAFIRGTDYLGLFIRLTVISGLILTFTDMSLLASAVLAAGTIFLTGIQLIPLVKHYDMLSIPDLYPVPPELKLKSFTVLLRNILLVQGAVLSAVLLAKAEWMEGAAALVCSVVFVWIFVNVYARQRIAKMNHRG